MRAIMRGGMGPVRRIFLLLPLVLLSLVVIAQPVRAEVIDSTSTGFVVRLVAEVTATPSEAWRAMINPAQWWSSQHTFSGDAANLTFDPVVGGCFCETLPRPEGAPAAQRIGGVQHMRVVYIEPPRAMRLVGALGPLQSEALMATMTMTFKPTDKGARILFEYVVGGFMRYKVDEIAPAVDRMLAAQLASLAGKLGPVAPVPAATTKQDAVMGPPTTDTEPDPAPAVSGVARPIAAEPGASGSLSGVDDYRLPPAGGTSAAALEQTPRPAAKPAVSAVAVPAAKPALIQVTPKPAPKPMSKTAGKTGAKAGGKPGAKPAPNPDDAAHRDANSAFDAALGAAPAP